MAAKKQKRRYKELRAAGLRKKSARRLSRIRRSGQADAGQRQAIARLRAAVTDLEDRAGIEPVKPRTPAEQLEVSDIRGVSVHG